MKLLGKRSVAWGIVVVAAMLSLFLGTWVSLNALRTCALDQFELGAKDREEYPYHIKGVSANAQAVLKLATKYLPEDDTGLHGAKTLTASLSDARTIAEVRQKMGELIALLNDLNGRINCMSAVETMEMGIYFGGLNGYREMLADDSIDAQVEWFNALLRVQPARAAAELFHISPLPLAGDLQVTVPDTGHVASVTPTPERGRYLAMDYVNAFVAAGFPLGSTMDYDEISDPISLLGRPGSYYSKATFNDSEANILHLNEDEPEDAVIEVFYTKEDMESRRRYLQSVSEAFPLFRMYTYGSPDGLALLRLDYEILPVHAEQYRGAFEEFCLTGSITPYKRLVSLPSDED